MDRWRPTDVVLIAVAAIGGLVMAYPLALAGYVLQVSWWPGQEPDVQTRLLGLGFIVGAGFSAAAGLLLAGAIRRSLAATILGWMVVGLGVTAAIVLGIVPA